MCNILREQGKEQDCLEILQTAVQRNPNDSYLWNYLGQSRKALKDHAGAAAAFARSADLLPENVTVRLQAAEEFIGASKFKEAEEQYRLLMSSRPDDSAAHYFLARLLGRDASRKKEALAEAREALRLASHPGAPPRHAIQSLIDAINSGRASGDELRL
jgi:predicted Zn-dependent protease